jgi:mono/diheme cytochrome c family protein
MSARSIVLAACLAAAAGVLLPAGALRTWAGAEKPGRAGGWRAAFTAGGKTDVRAERLAALFVPAGRPATPFLPAGPFRAVYTAELELELKAEHAFSAAGRGAVKITVNGVVAFAAKGDDLAGVKAKPVALKRGANRIVVTYDSPAKGDAVLRVFWAAEEFRREPLGLAQVRHEADKQLAAARQLREGREVLATHRCLRCHQADVSAWAKAGMPELEAEGPALAEVGARLRPGWLARWVQDPAALRPGATMPRLWGDAPRGDKAKLDPRARDVAAYLASLGKPGPAPAAKAGALEKGTRLFAQLGCIACHLPPDRDDFSDPDHARLPLRDVGAKYHPAALVAFLRQPDRHYPWVRMPNFQLTAEEAGCLAAYLTSAKPRDVFPATLKGADPEAGKKLLASAGCTSCHRLQADRPTAAHPPAPAYEKWAAAALDRGCLAGRPGKAPAYDLTATQRSAVGALVAADRAAPGRDDPAEFAARQLAALRCNACHKRDGQDDRWTRLKDENDGLTADLPALPPEKDSPFPAEQVRPTLTWVGEKLKPEWTARLLAGALKEKPRPYLRARMPAFPRRSLLLAAGLAAGHGWGPKSPPDAPADAKEAAVGRALAGKGRWNCVGCHMVGTAAAVGVFEAPGVNFAYTKERLRRDYFDRWLWAPTRVEPGTKMPVVYSWGKKSLIADVHDGDAGKQIDALWHYLQAGRSIKQPAE